MLNIKDFGWAVRELDSFIGMTAEPRAIKPFAREYTWDEILAQFVVVEQILVRVNPQWTDLGPTPDGFDFSWHRLHDVAIQARETIARYREVEEKLGDSAPKISASSLHPWVWEGAKSLWQSRHYREAVSAAARKVNAEAQNKLGRLDISEKALFEQAFTADPAQPGKPRLRLAVNDGSPSFRSLHRGAATFAEGCYAAIRNPNSHEDGLPELPEHEALEQLAAFSVLARWVDTATVDMVS